MLVEENHQKPAFVNNLIYQIQFYRQLWKIVT